MAIDMGVDGRKHAGSSAVKACARLPTLKEPRADS
jgi:hypothetical protein